MRIRSNAPIYGSNPLAEARLHFADIMAKRSRKEADERRQQEELRKRFE